MGSQQERGCEGGVSFSPSALIWDMVLFRGYWGWWGSQSGMIWGGVNAQNMEKRSADARWESCESEIVETRPT